MDGNERLHDAIKSLDPAQSKSLLNRVMASGKDGKSKFIIEYVNWLNNTSAIRVVLEEKQMGQRKKYSGYKFNQIEVLQTRLAEMQDASQQDSENQPLINAAAEISHVTTDFMQTNELDAMEQKIKDMDDLIDNFKVALAKRSSDDIKTMWNGNLLFRAWYCGQPVDFGNNQSQQPDMRVISLVALISNFKSALSSQKSFVSKAMWDGNDRLHKAIKRLDPAQSESLLKIVMGSNSSGKGKFITEYVNWLNDASAIRAVLEEKQMSQKKKYSLYKFNQIEVLQKRLAEMQDASQQDSVTNSSNSLITTNNSNQLTVPTPTNQSKKRKALPEAKTSRSKKQRTEVNESELSNLVKQMPALLWGQTHFCVEQAVGQNLQKLPKTIKDELGIGYIRKVRNQTQYKVEISDFSKYGDAYNKYTAPLFVTAANTNNPLSSQNQSTDAQSFSQQEEQRNNSENQPLINAAAKTSHVTTAVLLETEENHLDFIQNKFTYPDNMLEPTNPPTESNTSSTTILRSNVATFSQTTSSPTLFGHPFNIQNTNTFAACHTNTSTDEIIDFTKEKEQIVELQDASNTKNYSEQLLEYVQKGDDVRIKRIDNLLALGSDINYQDSEGFSPLMYAVDSNNERISEYVLICGANPFLKNKSGNTAITLTSRNTGIYKIIKGYELLAHTSAGNLSGIKSLLNADNSIIDFQRRDGYTPLLIATELGLREIVGYLLSRRPNLEITLKDGKGIFDLVRDQTIERLLKQAKNPMESDGFGISEVISGTSTLPKISIETLINDTNVSSNVRTDKNNFFSTSTNVTPIGNKHKSLNKLLG